MRKRLYAVLLTIALVCTACGRRGTGTKKEDGQYEIWFRSAAGGEDGAAIEQELRKLPEGREKVEALMALLLAGPEAMELTTPFPRNTFLREWKMEGDTVCLDLSEAYGGLSGADLTLADGCIVLTLCQLPQVERVYLTVEGRARPFRDQVLSPEDFLLSNGGEGVRSALLRLWFLSGEGLDWEERTLELAVGDDLAIAALQALFSGPESGNLAPVCGPETTLLSLTLREDCYTVDLSQEWLGAEEGEVLEEDPRRLQAIVETLAEITPGARVIFRVEGQPLERFGSLELAGPLVSREEH